jgi:conjugative transfer relaxase protein TraI
MLSLKPLDCAEEAASYYLDVVNYYEKDSKSIRWLGNGAKALGIHGQRVEKEHMISLLKGILPGGTQLGRIDKDGIHHRPGFDMTVTAPKSFSILLESGADPRLGELFDKATEWFVEEMEKEFAQARHCVDGKIEYIDTQNLVIAAFRQPNSRTNDPNSHTHLVVQNMTQCPDGKWRSLASDMDAQKGVVEQIMKHHIYGGLKFRNKLANLTKELGYSVVSDGDGLWEIEGVPEQVLTHFSKRREAIETMLEEKGWSGAKASSFVALITKLDKELIDFEQWKKDIIKECHDMGFEPQKLVESSLNPQHNRFQTLKEKIVARFYGKEHIAMNHAKEAVYVAIESVSQHQAVFDERELKKEALKHAIASNTIVDEPLIHKAIDEHIAQQNLYQAMHPYTQKRLLTTPWQLTLESEAIQRIENGKGAIDAICSQQTVRDFIKEKEQNMEFALSPSQKKAMTVFLTATDRFIAIQGYAGTGKTTMLRLTRELASRQGYELRGITAGSAAANELHHKGGLNASTFARELGRLHNQQQDLSKTIFVVDEASMLSNPQGHKIIKLAELYNTQLKIIGDKAQLPSPSSGKFFSVIQDYGIQTVAMTDNLRQTNPELKESAIHASLGEIYDAVEKLSHVETRDTYLKRVEYLAGQWLSLTAEERQNTLCFAPTHRNRKDITLIIRDALIKEGALTGNVHPQLILKERNLTSIKLRKAAYYVKNDVIRFNKTMVRHNIKAGEYLTVDQVSNKHKQNNTLSLKRENGQTLTFKLASLPAFKTENKDLERPIEVYRQETLHLMAGDQIQWKRNSEGKGLRNSELARIKQISKEGMVIATEDHQIMHFTPDAKELRHLDHGYVLTTYAAQGKDKKRGLGLIESYNRFASTIQNFYVEITRAIEEMIVVTDDKEHLVKAITTNDSDKYSSIDMVASDTLNAHATRFKENKNSIVLHNVIERKLSKEHDWRVLENTVETYAKMKQQSQTRMAAKLAFTLVNEPKLYRLAKERLGFKNTSYRRDALSFETSKLFHSLAPMERRDFSTVRQYVRLNQQIAKRIEQGKKNQSMEHNEFNSNQKYLQQLTMKRNTLAGQMGKDLERFKPYLKHFSIGALNRVGLSQHEYGRESKKAEMRLGTLAKHAALDQIRENVSAYLTANGEEREMIAAQIKREASLSHGFVISYAKGSNALWESIHRDAREHSDRLFRKSLSGDGRFAFDAMKEYKKVHIEIRKHWSESLKQQEQMPHFKDFIDQKSKTLFTLRNELAHQILQNKAMPEVATYFKIDLNTLMQQQQKHHYRENIQTFIANKSNLKERFVAINAIKNDMKGHYPLIKEANLDTKIISKYMRVTDRLERMNTLSDSEKRDYKLFLNYKMASIQAFKEWKNVHQDKQNSKKNDWVYTAISHSSKRDYLASQLEKSPYLDSFLSYEQGNKEKIVTHANNHQARHQVVLQINEMMHTLSSQYATIESKKSAKEVVSWKRNWSALCEQLRRVEHGSAYQFALKESPINFDVAKEINNALYQKYDYIPEPSHNDAQKLLSPLLQRLHKSSPYLDAQVINESLMACPEHTYKALWGEPKSQNTRELRYSGGLIVTLKGKDKGLWHDFTEGVGGAPIQAVMKKRSIPFQEALKVASDMAGMYQFNHQNTAIRKTVSNNKSADLERKNKIISAKSIWKASVSAQGTLAEKYLHQHRALFTVDNFDVRFLAKGSKWKNCNEYGTLEDKVNKIPALVIAARNVKGDITGVQRIYLDAHTANKNTFLENSKLSKGIIEASCAVIQKGMRGSRLYLAEGFETGASIALADSKATVLSSFGISNMKNLTTIIKNFNPKEIIIAGDNDGYLAKSQQAINTTIEVFKQNDLNAKALFPAPLDRKNKTDWNDILIHKGVAEIQRQLFGYDAKPLKHRLENTVSIPASITSNVLNKSTKFDDIKIQSIRDVSATLNKDRQLNQLLADYNKNNQQVDRIKSFAVEKAAIIKPTREMELEL